MQNADFFESVVDEQEAGQRVDQWLASKLIDVSRSQIKKWLSEGHVQVDGVVVDKQSLKLREGQVVSASAMKPEIGKLVPAKIPLDILYEDDELIVVNKAAGVVVHPGAGTKDPTLVEGILFHVGEMEGGDALRPGVVHRLDKDTTGVIVFAKNEVAHRKLAEQFAQKTNKREYVALLDGYIQDKELSVETYIYRDPAHRLRFTNLEIEDYKRRFGDQDQPGYRWAKSEFVKKLEFGHRLSLCFVTLHTGRTHQIRVHAKHLNAPVLGDVLYNKETVLPSTFSETVIKYVKSVSRQMLHARLLGFTHPKTGEWMEFDAPLPDDFKKLVEMLKPYAAG